MSAVNMNNQSFWNADTTVFSTYEQVMTANITSVMGILDRIGVLVPQ
jgi:hypothetical protein